MAGPAGVYGADSVAWKIHRETAVLAGGQAALLLQVAHPLVAAGVADHSGFPREAWRRLWRTLSSGLSVVFGTEEEARAAAERVNALHGRVRGTLREKVGRFPAGTAYDAMDPALLLWVHATLVWTSLRAYESLVGTLTPDERARYYEESKEAARAFELDDVPPTLDAFDAYVEATVATELAAGSDARRLARAILRPPPRLVPGLVWWPTEILTAGLLPGRVRDSFGLRFGTARRAAFRAAALVSRASVPRLPPHVRFVPPYRAARRRQRRSKT